MEHSMRGLNGLGRVWTARPQRGESEEFLSEYRANLGTSDLLPLYLKGTYGSLLDHYTCGASGQVFDTVIENEPLPEHNFKSFRLAALAVVTLGEFLMSDRSVTPHLPAKTATCRLATPIHLRTSGFLKISRKLDRIYWFGSRNRREFDSGVTGRQP